MDRPAGRPGDLLHPVAWHPGFRPRLPGRLPPVRHWGATRTTLVAYLIPPVGIVLGFLVLQEPIDGRLLIGTALVITGIGLVNSRFGRRRLFGRVPPIEAV